MMGLLFWLLVMGREDLNSTQLMLQCDKPLAKNQLDKQYEANCFFA